MLRKGETIRCSECKAELPAHYGSCSKVAAIPVHHDTRREGDEMACRCGLRWPVGEEHP